MYVTHYDKYKNEIENIKQLRLILHTELTRQALSKGVVDELKYLTVRDILPSKDFGNNKYGYLTDRWCINMTKYQWNGIPLLSKHYNKAVHILYIKKIIGLYGVRIIGDNTVSSIKFNRSGGSYPNKISYWHIDMLRDGEFYYTDEPLIWNNENDLSIDFMLKEPSKVTLAFIGLVAEKNTR